jgi:hypothetical protein
MITRLLLTHFTRDTPWRRRDRRPVAATYGGANQETKPYTLTQRNMRKACSEALNGEMTSHDRRDY